MCNFSNDVYKQLLTLSAALSTAWFMSLFSPYIDFKDNLSTYQQYNSTKKCPRLITKLLGQHLSVGQLQGRAFAARSS